ncbi:MAG: ribonuclease H-like domain-containing protein [Candidatus Acidiferrales bacterium]
MSLARDPFSGLAALKPARRRENLPASVNDSEPLVRGMMPEIPPGAERLTQILGASARSNRFGEHLGLRRWFSEQVGSGSDLGAPEDALDLGALRLIAPDAPTEVADPQQWLFLDTETTGLAGGSGTYAFLVGIAWWDAGGLEVEQFFMREHSEEHSLLLALAERMAERRVLVTFNGKSFDWPLLETRYRMTRTIETPVPRAHLDFLHPARNLWRPRLGSVRLPELERHVLGWNRVDDLMSELIPSIYFDYLRGGSPDPLVPIFHHNQMDLRGLAALATRVLGLLANPEERGHDALELFGVSRICERRGEIIRARGLYARSIDSELPEEIDRRARRSLAMLAKRAGEFDQARVLWEQMLGNSREGLEAYEQLAIHLERRARNREKAAALVREALATLRKANRLGTIEPVAYKRHQERFKRRLLRLERKTQRSLLDTADGASLASTHPEGRDPDPIAAADQPKR